MKLLTMIFFLLLFFSLSAFPQAGIVEAVRTATKKVIKAVDLKVQRLQNKTIWLQNAQKALENTMSKIKLREISDWVERQRVLYRNYFEELSRVKTIIAYYHRIRSVRDQGAALLREYHRALGVLHRDGNFTLEELAYMERVYTGILNEGIKNLEEIHLVLGSFLAQMPDAARLATIDRVAENLQVNYDDLRRFNRQNLGISVQRSTDQRAITRLKAIYGLD